ncbi:hypothetical protein DL96DRAFT_1574958 [Flagelloscypha sp. PMI_526]|nr:hypothetical protein DL96DRAFT_1574958 [Flagelloscypha sp. PMI_526]
MDPLTGEITVHFTSGSESSGHSAKKYVLTAIPKAQPRSLLSNASDGIFGGGGHTQSTPQAVAEADIDIQEYEVLHEERGEEAEVDDSTDYGRDVRVIQVQIIDDHNLLEKTKLRRRWRALQLRSSDARTGAI